MNKGLWHFCNAFKSIFGILFILRSMNALIAFLPPPNGIEAKTIDDASKITRNKMIRKRTKKKHFILRSFLMTKSMRYVSVWVLTIGNAHCMWKSASLGSQITINFHRSFYIQLHKYIDAIFLLFTVVSICYYLSTSFSPSTTCATIHNISFAICLRYIGENKITFFSMRCITHEILCPSLSHRIGKWDDKTP